MTRRTTDQWEALIDGITAGPWEYGEFEHCPYADMEDRATIHGGPMPEIPYPCGCEEGGTCQVQRCIVGAEDGVWADNPAFWEVNPADMKAVASFPEAVAELVRLRRELEQLRDTYVKRVVSCREQAAAAPKFFERRNALRFAHSYTLTHEALTRILNGDNHE